MGISNFDGVHTSGDMQTIPAAVGGTGGAVPDPNLDAGPNVFFQGAGVPDVRYIYLKDKVAGYTGVVPLLLDGENICLTLQIPAAASTTRLAAAQAAANGTAMTLATAQAVGCAPAIPIIPFSAGLNTGTATTALALDFGFAFGNVTSGSRTVAVSSSTLFTVGMPIIIGGVGNAAGTSALATIVTGLPTAATITIQDAPAASLATAPIGTGNLWGPSENGFPTPTAALPYVAKGPALVFDPRQAVCRGVSITSTDPASAGGVFTARGWDIFGQPMSEILTHAGGASTVFGLKAFKYIGSITPSFADAALYSAGTSDVFGFGLKTLVIEQTTVWWNAALNTSDQPFTAANETSPATSATGDVRGTVQFSANGPLAGLVGPASNGSIVGLAMSGIRLWMSISMTVFQQLGGTQANPVPMFGVTQA